MPKLICVKLRGALILLSLLVFLPSVSCSGPDYTALVVDAETGEPIEGAVYLAVWWKDVGGKKASWEGNTTEIDEFQEGVTKADGKIHVPYYWSGTSLGGERSLTVYKPGYVLWNSEFVFPDLEKRSVFSVKNSQVKLVKWTDGHTYIDHQSFLDYCMSGPLDSVKYSDGKQVFRKSFHEFERANH